MTRLRATIMVAGGSPEKRISPPCETDGLTLSLFPKALKGKIKRKHHFLLVSGKSSAILSEKRQSMFFP